MKKSIRTRLTLYFIVIIVLTVLVLEVALLRSVRQYYYKNVEELLHSKIELATDFYNRYFSSYSLDELIIDDVEVLWRQIDTQVQMIDGDGNVVMDSIGYISEDPINTADVTSALNGEPGTWIGHVPYDESRVLSVTQPIYSQGELVGVMRLVSSLGTTDDAINRLGNVFFWVGLVVIVISVVLSRVLANTIVQPLTEVTKVAEKMADGQFSERSDIAQEDEVGQLAYTLNLMAEEVVKREQIKNDFISSISHELRTPLTSIKGWAITLESLEEGEEELLKDGLEIIEKESDRLSKMVEELLDFSRFISGRIRLDKKEFSLDHLLLTIYTQMKPRMTNRNLHFKLDLQDELGMYMGDENRIRQVLINLIDNSIKFTPDKGTIILRGEKTEDHIEISVKDDGVGIAPEELPHVKEKFYKGKHTGSHSGIGLSISDEIMSLHEGELRVESVFHEYTKMTAVLPLQEVEV